MRGVGVVLIRRTWIVRAGGRSGTAIKWRAKVRVASNNVIGSLVFLGDHQTQTSESESTSGLRTQQLPMHVVNSFIHLPFRFSY